MRDIKGVSNSTLDGSLALRVTHRRHAGRLGWSAEDENWASILGCGDSLVARQRVELDVLDTLSC